MASTEHPKDYGIGMRIAEYRRALGWSQHQLAKRLKTNSHTVENWEQAAAIPSVESVMRLCEGFHITPNALLGVGETNVISLNNLPEEKQVLIRRVLQIFVDENNK